MLFRSAGLLVTCVLTALAVARLANRLKENGSDVEGWQRLLRAYVVLGERDKAHEAAADAKRALASDPDKLRRIEEMVKSLGLEG